MSKLNLGELNVKLSADGFSFDKTFDRSIKKLEAFGSSVQRIAVTSAKALAGLTVVGGYFIKVDSDAKELQNVVNKSFGAMSGDINNWAKDTAKAVNRSTYQMTDFVGTAQAMFKPMLKNEKVAADMSKAITKLAVDFGSFRNISDERSFELITAALMGEAEGLKRLGYNLQDTTMKDYALRKGIWKTYETMSTSEKMLLRYEYLMELMADVHGDATDTANELANSSKGLFGRLRNISEEFGSRLYPAANKFINAFNIVLDNFQALDPAAKNQILQFGLITAGILSAAVAFGVFVTAISTVGKAIGFLFTAGSALIPLLLVGGAVAAVGSMVYNAWSEDWGGIKTNFIAAFDAIRQWWDESHLKKALEEGIGELKKIWTDPNLSLGNKVIETLSIGIGVIKAIAWDAFELAKDIVVKVLPVAIDMLKVTAVKTFDFLGENAELFQTGLTVYAGLKLAQNAGQGILGAIQAVFSKFSSGVGAVGGGNLAIAAISIAVALSEAAGDGSWEKVGKNIMFALAAGIGVGIFNPALGVLTFTILLNFKVGEQLGEIGKQIDAQLSKWYDSIPKFNMEGFNNFFSNIRNFTNLNGYHDGGLIGFSNGGLLPGTSGQDQYPALLAPGEIVVPSAAVRKGSGGIMDWLRKAGVPGFKNGLAPRITGSSNTDIANSSQFIANISSGLDKALKVLVKSLEFIGKFIVELAKKLFGEENVQPFLDAFDELKKIFTGNDWGTSDTSSTTNVPEQTVTAPGFNAKATAISTAQGLAGNVYQNAPIAQDVVKGFEAGGLAGALTALISNSETFGQLMNQINPILQATADMFGMIIQPILPLVQVLESVLVPIFGAIGTILSALIEPAFKMLFPVIKFLGEALLFIVEVFQNARAFILDAIAGLVTGLGEFLNNIWGGLGDGLLAAGESLTKSADDARASAQDLADSRKELSELTYEGAMAQATQNEELKKASESIRNAPTGFKVAIARFNAAQGTAQATQMQAASRTMSPATNRSQSTGDSGRDVTININRPVYGVNDLKGIVRETVNEYFKVNKVSIKGV